MQIKQDHNFLDIRRFLPWIFAAIFVALLFSVLAIYSSFAMAFFLALILFLLFRRLHFLILKWVRDRRSLAAMLSTLIVVLIILIPATALAFTLVTQGIQAFESLRAWSLSDKPFQLYLENRWVDRYLEYISTDFEKLQQKLIQYSTDLGMTTLMRGGEFLLSFTRFGTNFVFSIFILFFIFRSADKIGPAIYRALPFPDELEAKIGKRMIDVLDAVLQGNLIIAVLQGFMVGIYFWVFSLPNPVLYGFIASLFSMIPVIGTAMVWGPASVYMYVNGQTGSALVLGFLGLLTYQLFDSLIKPLVLDRKLQLHP
ncbi:MAG: AI-2E family transporter, partial [Leptospiraceae bacterium]|nr:AI-2E family transporter [Leptospiraceae bacterium]